MAGKGIISRTAHNTVMFRLIIDGKVMDRIEVDDVYEIPESEIGDNESVIAKEVWDGE